MQPVMGVNHPVPYLYTSYENWAEPSLADLKIAMRESYNYFTNEQTKDKFVKYQQELADKELNKYSYSVVGNMLLDCIITHYHTGKKEC